MTRFKFLYVFNSPALNLFEIKRLDQPEGTPPGQVYKWLALLRSEQRLVELTFKSMAQDQREFAEGSLKYNGSSASFTFNEQNYQLIRGGDQTVVPEDVDLIQRFLDGEGPGARSS